MTSSSRARRGMTGTATAALVMLGVVISLVAVSMTVHWASHGGQECTRQHTETVTRLSPGSKWRPAHTTAYQVTVCDQWTDTQPLSP